EKIANEHFAKVGTEKGSGYNQYQRWLYEQRFHVDADGNFISAETENQAYQAEKPNLNQPNGEKIRAAWTELGPKSWVKTSGWNPGVGRLTSVAIHPSNTAIIYVTSPGGGIWKSSNSGSTWTPLIDFVNSSWMNLFHITIAPTNQTHIYAALTSGGVIKSTNSGVTWAATGAGPTSTKKVLVHPTNSSIVFATGSNGIWRSTNGGTSWTQVQTLAKEDIEFKPSDPNIMYASSNGTNAVWKSSDNGVTWTALTSANGITNTGRTLLAVSPNNANVVYAVQASGSIFGRIYKSTNSGASFTTVITGSSASNNFFGYNTSGVDTRGQATYDMAICVNPTNVNEVHIAGIICWKSTNGAVSFVPETEWSLPNATGYNHADVHGLEWVGTTIYSTSDGGIYKSTNNGGDWTDLSSGLGIRQFYRIACAKTSTTMLAGGAQDNGSTYRKTGGNFVEWLGADGMDCAISPTNSSKAIGTSQNGAIYLTTNAGDTRSNLTQPSSGNWVTPLVYHPTSDVTIYGGWTGVWKSVNSGTSWTNISSGVITGTVTCLAVAPSNANYIYATIGSTIYRTTNGGTTWTTVTAPASVNSICVSPINANKIWIACNSTVNRVYRSYDNGTTWTNLSTGLPSLVARSVAVDNNTNENLYVGMNIGVYYRDNVNTTWVEHATSLPLVAINEVEIQKSGNKLRVATYGRGVWESALRVAAARLDGSSSDETNLTIINGGLSEINLFPIPANNQLNYTFAATQTDETVISIISTTGKTIYQGRLSVAEGMNKGSIDISTFSAGNYIVHFNTNGKSESKKITIIK
ncbi:MAG TPA: T9SS type A sorting domain-containing protein, partial [Chitinophagaceae bacterium]|nr:T9SS type A sorting domain-containing protein [Chitinophagaceae bacterium]